MRKSLLLITLYFLISCFTLLHWSMVNHAEAYQSVENLGDKDLIWSYTFGENDTLDATYSIIPCSTGGYLLAGSTRQEGSTDVLLLRLNESGTQVWNRTIGGEGLEIAQEVIECESGGYAVIGYTQERWAFGTNLGYNAFLIRIDEDGSTRWTRSIGTNVSEQAYSIVEYPYSGFVFAGYTTNPEDGNLDFWLVRTNSRGIHRWNGTFGDERNEICHSIMYSERDELVMVGTRSINGTERQDGVIIITNISGVMLWEQAFGGQGVNIFYDVVRGLHLGYSIVGTAEDAVSGDVNALVLNTDRFGNIEWNTTFGSNFDEEVYSIFRCQNGGYIITGFTDELTNSGLITQLWVIRISAFGDLEWTKRYGGVSEEIGWSVVQASNDDFIIAGTTRGHTISGTNVWVIRVPDASPHGEPGVPDFNLIFLGVISGIIIVAGTSAIYYRSQKKISSVVIGISKRQLRKTFFLPRTLEELVPILSGIIRCRKCGTIVERKQMNCSHCSAQLHRCLFCDNAINSEASVIFCPNCRNLSHAHEMLSWLKERDKCPICGFKLKKS